MGVEPLFRNICLLMLLPLLALFLLAWEVHAVQDIGYLLVRSEPGYALVYLDGVHVVTTPTSALVDVKPGQHKIQLSRQGYKLHQERIAIRSGQALEISFVLAKLDSERHAESTQRYVEVYITIRSEPSGVDVYLDDEPIGKTSLLDYKVQPGEPRDRNLRIVKPGYKPYEETIKWMDIRDRIKIHVSAKLEPLKEVVRTVPAVKPRSGRRLIVNTQVIVLSIALLVIIAILTTRVIIRLRQRVGDD